MLAVIVPEFHAQELFRAALCCCVAYIPFVLLFVILLVKGLRRRKNRLNRRRSVTTAPKPGSGEVGMREARDQGVPPDRPSPPET